LIVVLFFCVTYGFGFFACMAECIKKRNLSSRFQRDGAIAQRSQQNRGNTERWEQAIPHRRGIKGYC
jgi:hypothetical protein